METDSRYDPNDVDWIGIKRRHKAEFRFSCPRHLRDEFSELISRQGLSRGYVGQTLLREYIQAHRGDFDE